MNVLTYLNSSLVVLLMYFYYFLCISMFNTGNKGHGETFTNWDPVGPLHLRCFGRANLDRARCL